MTQRRICPSRAKRSIELPRTTYGQIGMGVPVSRANIQPAKRAKVLARYGVPDHVPEPATTDTRGDATDGGMCPGCGYVYDEKVGDPREVACGAVAPHHARADGGTRARVDSQPAAGKTGTAQQSRDAWFVGYTPQYATAVWMGATVGQVPMRSVGGISVTGGSYPARIFGQANFARTNIRMPKTITSPSAISA